ncbi:MAG: DUF177 domain-containing protein [Alphaproteobacteria bacterium]|nr:DUF177 domain-containing protein [Alphaproteobacteria bacterium]
MPVLSSWNTKVHEIPRAGLSGQRQATAQERSAIADRLEIPDCISLSADYRIKNAGKGRFALTGTLTAQLRRTCVITLDPIIETVRERLDCVFLPPDKIPQLQIEEEEALTAQEFEPIVSDTIDVGRIAFEVLSAGLNPFPRKPDAQMETPPQKPKDNTAPEDGDQHPFAALAKLVRDPKKKP